MRRLTALVLVLGTAVAVLAAPAAADRKPTKREARAIKRAGLKACSASDCRYNRGRVSTRNARFAWADVTGEGFSGALLKRPTRRSRRFRVVGVQGGGIGTCAYWRKRAPRPVLRDLRISGLVGDSFEVRNCG